LIWQIKLRRLSIFGSKTQCDKILRRNSKYALQENAFLFFAIDGDFFGFVIFLGGGWGFCHGDLCTWREVVGDVVGGFVALLSVSRHPFASMLASINPAMISIPYVSNSNTVKLAIFLSETG